MRCKSPLEVEQSLQKYGPSLNAVWDNKNLGANQKHLMNFLTRSLNMNDLITDFRQVLKNERIAQATGFSVDTVRRTIKSLVSDGYLEKIKCTNTAGKQLANVYLITTKLFDEYRELLIHLNKKFEGGDRNIFAKESVVHRAKDGDDLSDVVQHHVGVANCHPYPSQIATPKPLQIATPKPSQIATPILFNNKNNKLYNFSSAPEALAENENKTPTDENNASNGMNTPEPQKKLTTATKTAKNDADSPTGRVIAEFRRVVGNQKIVASEANKLKIKLNSTASDLGITITDVEAIAKNAVVAFARSREPLVTDANYAFFMFVRLFHKFFHMGETMLKKSSRFDANEHLDDVAVVMLDDVS